MSADGLNAAQANKFAKQFSLQNLRLEGGFWVADQVYDKGEVESYSITAECYWAAWHEGDLG